MKSGQGPTIVPSAIEGEGLVEGEQSEHSISMPPLSSTEKLSIPSRLEPTLM
jgi:hypothetical protein